MDIPPRAEKELHGTAQAQEALVGNTGLPDRRATAVGRGLVLRVYESQGQRETVTVAFALPVLEIHECNLMEDAAGPASFAEGKLTFDIRAF
jgi:alpha-mannosidase